MKSITITLALVATAAATATAGTITYFWDINDTGQDFYFYFDEEVINFKLYALMEPGGVAFASSTYDILGGDEYSSAGEVISYTNHLGSLTDDGELQGNNDILNIEALQLPPFFGDTDYSNPILLYEIDWEITEFFMIATLTSANHLNSDVYVDDFGTSESYETITTTATVLIPAPGSVLLIVGLLAWRRRR